MLSLVPGQSEIIIRVRAPAPNISQDSWTISTEVTSNDQTSYPTEYRVPGVLVVITETVMQVLRDALLKVLPKREAGDG